MLQSDITIIGSGFFGTFSALLLSKQGYSVTLVSQETKPLDSCRNSLGVLWPSLNDPPTRATVAHGPQVASYLSHFCQHGIDFFISLFSQSKDLNKYWIKAPSLRVGLQNFEQQELEQAKNLGFALTQTSIKEIYLENNASYICTNELLFQEEILNLLTNNSVTIIKEKAIAIEEKQSHCSVHVGSKSLKSEILILANALQISSLLPKYKSVLVPMSDILVEYECVSEKKLPAVSFRTSNGHIAVSLLSKENKTIVKVTGPRFLLPQAGVGLILNKENINTSILSNIEKFHKQIFTILASYYDYASVGFFLNDFPFERQNYSVGVDCHPCDELPLIGEFGKFGKILGCTGFLATGFSAGVWGAKIISDLICEQKSSALHERLQPRRFYKMLNP